jgi:hypothetical protein
MSGIGTNIAQPIDLGAPNPHCKKGLWGNFLLSTKIENRSSVQVRGNEAQ